MLRVTGHMNPMVEENWDYDKAIGKLGLGQRNDNGERLCECCGMNELVMTGTLFPRKYILKATCIRGTQRQLSENICSEDDLRSRTFGTFFVNSCLPASPRIFEHLKKWYNCPFLTDSYLKKVT